MLTAEGQKLALRSEHYLQRPRCYDEAFEQAMKFYERYEQVNRDFLPDDPVYSVVRAGIALATTTDLATFIAAAAAQVRFIEIMIGGEQGTSSVVRWSALQRSTGGVTGGGAVTAEKFNTRSPAATTVTNTTWGTQPTLSGNPMLSLAFNAFGGFIDWKAAPGEEIYIVNSEQISSRPAVGTAAVSATFIFEEL